MKSENPYAEATMTFKIEKWKRDGISKIFRRRGLVMARHLEMRLEEMCGEELEKYRPKDNVEDETTTA